MTKMRDTVLFSSVLKRRDMPPTHLSGHEAESEGCNVMWGAKPSSKTVSVRPWGLVIIILD